MKNCILCGETLRGEPLLTCENMPASAQNIPAKDELSSDKGIDLSLYQCERCGLVQFDCEPVDYYRDVIRAGGFSTTMVNLRREQYRRFIDMCDLTGKKIVEIGSGGGEFLSVLEEFPVRAYGIEHREELVRQAVSRGLNVQLGFTESVDMRFNGGPFDAFLSFNFLEHQPDPNTMMRCIYNNLTDDGCGLITVPAFEYILENDGFYELLRDHIANYTKDSLRFLVEKNGFMMSECRRVNRDTWAMTVRKRPKADVSGLKANFDELRQQMNDFVGGKCAEGKKIAVWGAGHQGFTALSTTGVGDKISYIIDSAPFKQNRYAPASHVKIVPPEHYFDEPVDGILIIAPGYTEEIAASIREKYGQKVEIYALRTARIEKIR